MRMAPSLVAFEPASLIEAGANGVGERGRTRSVKTELNGGRHLVDVLPARARRANEPLFKLAFRR